MPSAAGPLEKIMRVSISVSGYSWPDGPSQIPRQLGEIARAADEAGVDTIWLPDHLIQVDPRSTPEADMLEAYATLGFLAGQTERVRLGTLVTGVTYRPPALLVKTVTTLDVLSGGRVWFRVGAGYHEGEAAGLDLPLPPVAERFARLEETLRIALQMWSGDTTAFHGSYYRLAHPLHSPAAVQKPHPPILIGGSGERKTLRLVAQYADACNLSDFPDGGKTVTHKLGVLARHCADLGRPLEDIDKTVSTRFIDGEAPAEFAERCGRRLAGLGLDHAVLFPDGPWTAESVRSLAAAVEAVRDIRP
jgi:F420-dependent oxidoreductase-like protein